MGLSVYITNQSENINLNKSSHDATIHFGTAAGKEIACVLCVWMVTKMAILFVLLLFLRLFLLNIAFAQKIIPDYRPLNLSTV